MTAYFYGITWDYTFHLWKGNLVFITGISGLPVHGNWKGWMMDTSSNRELCEVFWVEGIELWRWNQFVLVALETSLPQNHWANDVVGIGQPSNVVATELSVNYNYWPSQEPIYWRYRFHIFLAYVLGLNFREYPPKNHWPINNPYGSKHCLRRYLTLQIIVNHTPNTS